MRKHFGTGSLSIIATCLSDLWALSGSGPKSIGYIFDPLLLWFVEAEALYLASCGITFVTGDLTSSLCVFVESVVITEFVAT